MDTEHVESQFPVIHRDFLPSRKDLDDVIKEFTHLKVENFGRYVKEVDGYLQNPRGEVERHAHEVRHRLNVHVINTLEQIKKHQDEILQYIDSYEKTSYSKLEAVSQDIHDFKKLISRCNDKYNEWASFINKKDFENKQLMNIVLEAIGLRCELHDEHDTMLFSLQKLFSLENKLYKWLHSKELNCHDYFFLDMNRLKSIKTGKLTRLDRNKTFNCKIFPTYGSHVICAWSEYGMYKLQLLELQQNSESLHLLNTVTNSASEDAFIDGSNDGSLIGFLFTFDTKTYWLKAYNATLKETGIIKLDYAPIALRIHEHHIYVFSSQTPLVRVYDSKLVEVDLYNKTVEPYVYYLLKYGVNIVFRNDFVFVYDSKTSAKMDIIHRDSDQIMHSINLDKIKLYYVDSLLRLILYNEETNRLIITDLNNNKIHELELHKPITSICSTDNGYLMATSGGEDGEVILF